jgi:hypothetical protein
MFRLVNLVRFVLIFILCQLLTEEFGHEFDDITEAFNIESQRFFNLEYDRNDEIIRKDDSFVLDTLGRKN